jgi:DNA-binding SARP family transcriptional activator
VVVEYRLLGTLAVIIDGRPVPVQSGRQRALLAALLLRAGDVVSFDELVDPLWSESPPSNPRASLHTLVTRLRQLLSPIATDLETRPNGYRLRVPAGALDLERFLTAVADARRAARDGDLVGAADSYAAAAALWSGPPLADVPSDWLQQHEVPRLNELRLNALEQQYAIELQLGRHDTLVAPLRAEVDANPLRERFWAQLMRALYAAQRQSEALEAYRSVVALLRDELGIDPGPELQRLHQEILAGEAPLVAPEPSYQQPALYQLPPDIADFVGRDETVAAVEGLLAPAVRGDTAVPVVVLWGQAGVGKTTTAVHIAHRLRGRYPDGQLHVQLGGAGPVPREPVDVLADLLRDLGVEGRRLPDGVDRRAAAYRSRLADRRILVVLDDVASVGQLAPLLPGTPSCGVLVTSRRWLGGLASVRSIQLEPLHPGAAMALLAATAGGERVAADRESAARVLAACGNLPLAVRIAGARLGRSPLLALDRFAGRLADDRGRLDELTFGEVTIRAGLRLSYEAQPVDARRLLRAMGALSTPVVPGWALPALLPDRSVTAVETAAEELAASSLVHYATSAHTGEPRLQLHELVRVFAAELSGPDGTPAVLDTLLPAAIELAGRAVERMPWPANVLPAWCPPPKPARPPDTAVVHADPAGWFADERAFLLRLVAVAAAAGGHRDAVALLRWLHIPLVNQYRWQEYDDAWAAVRRAAGAVGDLAAYHHADYALASGQTVRGDTVTAIPTLQRCLTYFTEVGDQAGAAAALNDLGLCHTERGDTDTGDQATAQALALYRKIGDRYGEARALRALGMTAHVRGDYDRASQAHREALEVAVELEEPLIEADVLNSMSVTMLALGRYREAARIASRAETIFEAHDDRTGAGYQRYLRGIATAGAGDRRRARTLLQEAHVRLTAVADLRGATLAARDLAGLTIDEDPRGAALALRDCMETFHIAGMARFEGVSARLLAMALRRLGDREGARVALVRADSLEPPGNANTARLLEIILG